MIDLYYWTTPNGHKITMALEELGLDYNLYPIDISKGEQFSPEFSELSPNQRIPAIIDNAPFNTFKPISIFESGAILQYLAEKSRKLIGESLTDKYKVLQWLAWQVAGLGPMAGQNHHFIHYASEQVPYAINRYQNETNRLYSVMDKQLAQTEYLAGNFYSIADIACYPWIRIHAFQSIDIEKFSNLKRWLNNIKTRPSTIKAFEVASRINTQPTVNEKASHLLFNQSHVK
ncbi:glutathione binding-like protein [Pseudoalteromonas sp.]|uniref:glutathione binding-like protein n=1 Tax=Pseudoalteromonas sp. TaxID=53249 RepID=UPI00235439D1|nr:glutathione binding-like protein [Pseudoalteromonas sp.]